MEKETKPRNERQPGGDGHEPPWKLDVQGVKIESVNHDRGAGGNQARRFLIPTRRGSSS